MDPTLWINNDKHFGKNFGPAEGEVHVLVVVPKQGNVRSPYMALLEAMLPHMLTNAPTMHTDRKKHFKDELCKIFGCYRRNNTWVRYMLLDVEFPKSLAIASHLFRRNMLLDVEFPKSLAIASHLFRRSNEYLSLLMMQIPDIDDVKNGLLLFKPLKYAFDHFQISFIRDDTDVFRLKLFDPDIRNIRLIDIENHSQKKTKCSESISLTEEEPCHFDVETTFGDVDGSILTFTGIERPFYRCLNLQARLARIVALKKQWIDASYDFKEFWSEVSLNDKMEMFHRSIMETELI
ncbi:Crinkler (CRN) family protein [Phytophthora palmivora]|uniref:Crinkler (CRN) family protein n=1 Tax=Phytophthora palmivora TaxID=4796 RepID=A0A2P4XY35_9STRA|nr:Crinkler (CRN) family protein [Phytophthora palmivora]